MMPNRVLDQWLYRMYERITNFPNISPLSDVDSGFRMKSVDVISFLMIYNSVSKGLIVIKILGRVLYEI